MNAIVLIALLGLASSSPLEWTSAGRLNVFQIPSKHWLSSGQFLAQQNENEIQQAEEENVFEQRQKGLNSYHQQTINQHALQARQIQTVEGIQWLRQQNNYAAPQTFGQSVQQVSITNAIQQLIQQLQRQQATEARILENTQLSHTLEAVLQSQLVSDNVEVQQLNQVGQSSRSPAQNSRVFQARVRQLIDQTNIHEIQAEIVRQQTRVQQLQQQQQFVTDQIQQIQTQQFIVQRQSQGGPQVIQLQQAQQLLQVQEQQLIRKQVARQFVIEELQQALVEEQRQLEQDTVTVQASGQAAAQGEHTWSQNANKFYQSGNRWVAQRGNRYPWTQGENEMYQAENWLFATTNPWGLRAQNNWR